MSNTATSTSKPSGKWSMLVLLFALTLCLALSCGRKGKTDAIDLQLSRADSLMLDDADKAAILLKQLKDTSLFTDEQKAHYALVSAVIEAKKTNNSNNDSLINIAADYYRSGDDAMMKARTELAAGMVYAEHGEDAKAIKSYMEAEKLAKPLRNDNLLYHIYLNWGWLIRAEVPYEEAMKKYNEAGKYAARMKDTDKQLSVLDLEGWEYIYQGNTAKAQATFDKAIEIAEKRKDGKGGSASRFYKGKAMAYWQDGDYKAAIASVNRAMNSDGDSTDRSLMAMKGRIFADLHQFDSARYYIEKGKSDEHYYQLASYYDDMASLERMTGNLKLALDYKDRYENYLDSANSEDRENNLMKIQRLYNYSSVLAERNRFETESHRKSVFIFCVTSLCAVISAIVFLAYYRFRRRTAMQLMAKQELIDRNVRLLKDRNYELMMTRQKMHDKETVLSTDLNMKSEEVTRLREEQQKLRQKIFVMDEVIMKIQSLKAMNEAKKIKSAKDIALSDQELDNLLNSINLCYDNFADRLKARFSDLTALDLYLCCLLKMGVDNQNICLLLQMNDSTMRKRKYRMKKQKMQLDDSFDTLDDFIKGF